MRRGESLSDADRAPWLATVHELLLRHAAAGPRLVLACSALKAAYRTVLLAGIAGARVICLHADRATLAGRVAARGDHFFPPALVDRQLAALEEPDAALVIDATLPVEAIVAQIVAAVA